MEDFEFFLSIKVTLILISIETDTAVAYNEIKFIWVEMISNIYKCDICSTMSQLRDFHFKLYIATLIACIYPCTCDY